MRATLPNLELLEYQAKMIIKKDKEVVGKIRDHYKNAGYVCFKDVLPIELDAHMFPQTWGSGCTAFDVDRKGRAVISTQAVTKAYTVVFREPVSNTYLVFIDGNFAYLVYNPTAKFLKDFEEMRLRTVSEAAKVY